MVKTYLGLREQTDSYQRAEGLQDWVRKEKGLNKIIIQKNSDTDTSMMIIRKKGGGWR